MSVRFRCQHCGKKLKARPEQAGMRFRCSGCNEEAQVPGGAADLSLTHSPAEAQGLTGRKRPPLSDGEMDMTPMVDVVFNLLIFFMVTASFAAQKAIETPVPDPTESSAQSRTMEELEQDNDYVVVQVDQDSVVWVDDHEAPTRQELVSRLRDARNSSGARFLMVTAHGQAQYDKVVMVLDVGNTVGMERISVSVEDD